MRGAPLWLQVSGLTILLALGVATVAYFILWEASKDAIVKHETNDLGNDTNLIGFRVVRALDRFRADTRNIGVDPRVAEALRDGIPAAAEAPLRDRLHADPDAGTLGYLRAALLDASGGVLALQGEPIRELPELRAWLRSLDTDERRAHLSELAPGIEEVHCAYPVHGPDKQFLGHLIVSLDFQVIRDIVLAYNRAFPILTDHQGRILVQPPELTLPGTGDGSLPQLLALNVDSSTAPKFFEQIQAAYGSGTLEGETEHRFRDGLSQAMPTQYLPDSVQNAGTFGRIAVLSSPLEKGSLTDEQLLDLAHWLREKQAEGNIRVALGHGSQDIPKLPFRLIVSAGEESTLEAIQDTLEDKYGLSDTEMTNGVLTHFCLYKLYPDPTQLDRNLGVALIASEEEFHSDSQPLLRTARWQVIGASSILAVVIGVWVGLFITRPLRAFTKAAVKIGEGDYEHANLPRSSTQEIISFAETCDKMVSRIKHREARLEAILNNASEGIVITDSARRIESINKAAEQIFGYSTTEVKGRSFRDLLDSPGEDSSLAERSDRLPGESSVEDSAPVNRTLRRRELTGIRKDGSRVPVEVSGELTIVHGERIYVFIIRDITEEQAAELEKRHLNEALQAEKDSLAERVAERTAELRQTNERLERALKAEEHANTAKDVFLSAVSHELRTPLTSVINGCDVLMRLTKDNPRALERVQKIRSSGVHQLGIIKDILDYQKMIMGKLDLELTDFELPGLVGEAADTIRPKSEERDNQLVVECPAELGMIHADRRRVMQILLNLLSNACKFTREGTISLRVCPEWDTIRFEVSDTGRGIPASRVNDLFKPFNKILDRKDNPDGTGLGLAICKQLAQLMGGDIRCDSTEGVGTTFFVRIPIEVQPPKPGSSGVIEGQGLTELEERSVPSPYGTSTQPADAPSGKSILVIDDDPSVGDIMNQMLEGEGYRVLTARNGEEGVRLAKQHRPSAITLDVVMPEMDGWTTLSKLKEDPATADIPVFMLTMLDAQRKGITLGARDVIHKPVEDWSRVLQLFRDCAPSSGADILVVDDDPEFGRLVREEFANRQGYQVREVLNGSDALRCLEERIPSLILLDLLMPGMDGFEFLEVIQQDERFKDIPVVVATAKDLSDPERNFLHDHVRRTLEKGMPLEELARVIQRTVRPDAQENGTDPTGAAHG